MTRPCFAGIYAITNTLNGKQYIGSASNIAARWQSHRFHLKHSTHHNEHLQRAYQRYGAQVFEFSVLERVDDPLALIAREQYFLDTLKPVYNICRTAGRVTGRSLSAKQRAVLEEHNKRQIFTAERRQRMSELTKAQWQRPGMREKLGRAIAEGQAIFHAANPDFGKQRVASQRGKKLNLSDEERKRRSERSRQPHGPMSEQEKEKRRAGMIRAMALKYPK